MRLHPAAVRGLDAARQNGQETWKVPVPIRPRISRISIATEPIGEGRNEGGQTE